MKGLIALVAAAGALLVTGAAAAHPLGNFTVNRFSAVELSGRDIYVHYVLDLAEIPTYQEGGRVRSPGFPSALARGFVLELDGTRTVLVPVKHKLSTKPGAGGLPTLRFEAVFRAHPPAQGTALVFHDTNFADRIGWKEVVVRADHGASIQSSSVPSTSESEELRAYPKNLLKSPLDVTSVHASVGLGSGPGVAPLLEDGAVQQRTGGGFESLIARGELGAGVILVSLLIAAFWGAAHALTPGHGKAIVAGYLVGSRGKPRHAVLLGGIVTVTHTAGVFALGLVTLLLSQFVVPERLYPWPRGCSSSLSADRSSGAAGGTGARTATATTITTRTRTTRADCSGSVSPRACCLVRRRSSSSSAQSHSTRWASASRSSSRSVSGWRPPSRRSGSSPCSHGARSGASLSTVPL
jgi:nickel/cobalt transporter (NicO) family protein